jgi:hypothetical protein
VLQPVSGDLSARALIAPSHALLVGAGLLGSRWSPPRHLATGAAAIVTLAALWWKRYHLARVAWERRSRSSSGARRSRGIPTWRRPT